MPGYGYSWEYPPQGPQSLPARVSRSTSSSYSLPSASLTSVSSGSGRLYRPDPRYHPVGGYGRPSGNSPQYDYGMEMFLRDSTHDRLDRIRMGGPPVLMGRGNGHPPQAAGPDPWQMERFLENREMERMARIRGVVGAPPMVPMMGPPRMGPLAGRGRGMQWHL